jgi:hypothetical protein
MSDDASLWGQGGEDTDTHFAAALDEASSPPSMSSTGPDWASFVDFEDTELVSLGTPQAIEQLRLLREQSNSNCSIPVRGR